MVDRRLAKQKAEKTIETYGLSIPFPIEDLVAGLGLSLILCTPEEIIAIAKGSGDIKKGEVVNAEEVLGYYDKDAHRIAINKKQPINRLRFTIAHEIGHAQLDHNGGKFRKIFFVKDFFSTDKDEVAANYYAGYLLMPDKEVKRLLPVTELMYSGQEIIHQFAKMFSVSSEAVRIRLKTFREENETIWKEFNLSEKLF